MKHLLITMLLPVLLLTACGDGRQVAVVTDPAPLDREAIGRYCQMIVADHPGPKAQILLDDGSAPIWFSSVRDGIAFTRLPEEPRNIAAFYVNDMSDTDWEHPDDSTWISAGEAWFVIDSARMGGMGAPEAVPFVSEPAATAFAAAHGGTVLRLDAIPVDYILGAVPSSPLPSKAHAMHSAEMPTMRPGDGHMPGGVTREELTQR